MSSEIFVTGHSNGVSISFIVRKFDSVDENDVKIMANKGKETMN